MHASILEYTFYEIFNFAPYLLLVIYPLRFFCRHSKRVTALMAVILFGIQWFLAVCEPLFHLQIADLLTIISVACNLAFYFLCFKTGVGRLVFNMLLVTNLANLVIVAGKYVEGIFFPDSVYLLYHWTFTVCMILVQIVVLPPVFLLIRYNANNHLQDSYYQQIWKFAWIIPAVFYLIWFYTFYYSQDTGSVNVALQLKTVIFNLFIVIAQLVLYQFTSSMTRYYTLNMKKELAEEQLAVQATQYKRIQEQIEETRILRHDMRHHFRILTDLAEKGEFEKLQNYLRQCSPSEHLMETMSFCKNPQLNVLMNHAAQRCRGKSIEFSATLAIPEELPLSPVEMSVLFGNLLENAYEACKEMDPTEHRFLHVTAKYQHKKFLFTIENSFENPIIRDGWAFKTTKPHGSGFGTKSAANIVNDHGGNIYFMPGDKDLTKKKVFTVSIILPDKPQKKEKE